MEDEKPLQALLDQFRNGYIDRRTLEGRIFSHLKRYPGRFKLRYLNEEERIDLLLTLYPRIARGIDRYEERGSCFDGYVSALISWGYRTALRQNQQRDQLETFLWSTKTEEAVQEPTLSFKDVNEREIQRPKNPRQVLILTLKCCLYISDDFAGRIARAVGMEKSELWLTMEKLKEKATQRIERRQFFEEKVGAYWCRILTVESKISGGDEAAERLKEELVDLHKRHDEALKRLEHCESSPSNKEIAEILGIPKGTVDASLYFIKKRQAALHQGRGPEV